MCADILAADKAWKALLQLSPACVKRPCFPPLDLTRGTMSDTHLRCGVLSLAGDLQHLVVDEMQFAELNTNMCQVLLKLRLPLLILLTVHTQLKPQAHNKLFILNWNHRRTTNNVFTQHPQSKRGSEDPQFLFKWNWNSESQSGHLRSSQNSLCQTLTEILTLWRLAYDNMITLLILSWNKCTLLERQNAHDHTVEMKQHELKAPSH